MPDRFAKVRDGLYRGGKPSPEDLETLKRIGIKKIVSLDDESGNDIKPMVSDLGFDHIIWGLGDGKDPKVSALKKRIVPTLLHGGPTYVHCFHGKDRTGMTIAMFRVYSGWPVEKALEEAHKFGMGKDLPKNVRDSYYTAVSDFAKEYQKDKDNAMDAVSLTRSTNSFGPQGTGLNDMTFPRSERQAVPPHADIEFSNLSRIAYARIYCKCNSYKILKTKTFWWGTSDAAKNNPTDPDGRLYSAGIDSSARLERFDRIPNTSLIHNILIRDNIDVAAFRDGSYFVIIPNVLVNIQEESDINDLFEVGLRDNSTNYTHAYPGSGSGIGGMPDGAAGIVQLPYSGQSEI